MDKKMEKMTVEATPMGRRGTVRRWPTSTPSWPRTRRATSPAPCGWWTAASPSPRVPWARRRSKPRHPAQGRVDLHHGREGDEGEGRGDDQVRMKAEGWKTTAPCGGCFHPSSSFLPEQHVDLPEQSRQVDRLRCRSRRTRPDRLLPVALHGVGGQGDDGNPGGSRVGPEARVTSQPSRPGRRWSIRIRSGRSTARAAGRMHCRCPASTRRLANPSSAPVR